MHARAQAIQRLIFTGTLAAALPGAAATFTVLNTNDSGPDSLREAITKANTNAGTATVAFSIPGPPYTIFINSLLPTITNAVIIDGYSQPGAHPNSLPDGDNASVLVELTTANALVSWGLLLSASNCTVRGLAVNGFTTGIALEVGGGDLIEGNFLGVAPSGTNASPRGAGTGIFTSSAPGTNIIGGVTPASRNIISGNVYGMDIRNGSCNIIEGNFIGTDRTGTNALPNTNYGLAVQSSYNIIGGSTPGARNVISGNVVGVYITSANARFNAVQGNFIGTDVTGMFAVPNSLVGVSVGGQSNLVGGAVSTPGAAPGNVISGNTTRGLEFSGSAQRIQGNVFGLNAVGTGALPNVGDAILADGARTLIGGTNAGEGNVISANTGIGISTTGNGGSTNWIAGNWIGTDATGTLPLGNGSHGIRISGGHDCTIGPDNILAFNGGDGLALVSAAATADLITRNSIYGNALHGIDLSLGNSLDGPTANDACDSDSAGANLLQNYPVLTNVISTPGSTTIQGYLPSAANGIYRLEFFASEACDFSGFGQGKEFLGSIMVTVSPDCTNSFSAVVPSGPLGGKVITATATDASGNTSEFSQCLAAESLASSPLELINPLLPGDGSFRFEFTNNPGAPFTVLAATNPALPLSNWTVLTPPAEVTAGHFQFQDAGATNVPARFYRVTSP